MSSRDKEQTAPHHPVLSSLVVRASDSSGGGGDGGITVGTDYEPGEFHRESSLYSHADRFSGGPGYRIRAGSSSPIRRRNPDRYNSEFGHLGGLSRYREFSSERNPSRYRNHSPHYGRGRGGSRSFGRGSDGPGFGPGSFRSEGVRSNPNVRPREGDWICPDPLCGNLNFARREQCNSCNRYRDGPGGSPRRGYPGPPPSRRLCGPPMDRSPGKTMNGYRSPPHAWARDGSREFGGGPASHRRHDGRFPDHNMRRDRLDCPEDDFRERSKFDRPAPPDWGHRDRGRDSYLSNERKGYGRRPPSPPPPPPPPPRGRWGHDIRARRSRSPVRGGPVSKDYGRDLYMARGRGDRHGIRRERFGDPY